MADLSSRVDGQEVSLALLNTAVASVEVSASTLATASTNLSSTISSLSVTVGTHTDALAVHAADLSDHSSSLASLANAMNALSATQATLATQVQNTPTSVQLWLYDANNVRRHKVLSFTSVGAIVEIRPTLRTEYRIGSMLGTPVPRPLWPKALNMQGVGYEVSTSCDETAPTAILVRDWSGGYAGAGYLYTIDVPLGSFLFAVDVTAPVETSTTIKSASTVMYGSDGGFSDQCQSTAGYWTFTGLRAKVVPVSTFTYPAPLTVGP